MSAEGISLQAGTRLSPLEQPKSVRRVGSWRCLLAMEGDQRNMSKQKEKTKSEKPEKEDLKKKRQQGVCLRNAGRVCTTMRSDRAARGHESV